MTSFVRRYTIVSVLIAAALVAGCGGGSQSSSSQASAVPTATTEAQREQAALPTSAMQPVPKDLGCSGSDVVWVNLKSKSYHESGDPYYGRTKNGKYMCKTAADAAGYHMAGAMHTHHSKMMNGSGGNSPSDNGTPSDNAT
ncbi:MAG TPA: hypothetical protein VID24_01270 [Candidatus Eremiobacteraceae bacterium]|jgi:hypothetical protein